MKAELTKHRLPTAEFSQWAQQDSNTHFCFSDPLWTLWTMFFLHPQGKCSRSDSQALPLGTKTRSPELVNLGLALLSLCWQPFYEGSIIPQSTYCKHFKSWCFIVLLFTTYGYIWKVSLIHSFTTVRSIKYNPRSFQLIDITPCICIHNGNVI